MILGTMTGAISVLYILELGGTIFDVNLITTISNAMGIMITVPFGTLSDHLGRRPTVLYPLLSTDIQIFLQINEVLQLQNLDTLDDEMNYKIIG
jgi:hypothetical protein